MIQTVTKSTRMPSFLMFPRFLLDSHWSSTTLEVYLLLLDRARLSMTRAEWIDRDGKVFQVFTIRQLAQLLKRSQRRIFASLKELEQLGYIERKKAPKGRADLIYVKLPSCEENDDNGRKLPQLMEQNVNDNMTFSTSINGTKVPPNNNYKERTKKSNNNSNKERRAYGQFENVYLTEAEYTRLSASYPNLDRMIENMSCYLASAGKQYANYEAALRSWAARDSGSYANISYECGEEESL